MRVWRKKQTIQPIWIKDQASGLYERIPYEYMTQTPSGKWCWCLAVPNQGMLGFVYRHLDHFEYSVSTDTWVFCPGGTNATKSSRWASIMASAALGANTMVLALNLWQHLYLWAAFPAACVGLCLYIQCRLRDASVRRKS